MTTEWDRAFAIAVRLAEKYGFTEADVQRVVDRTGILPTDPELKGARGRLVSRILMEGHSDS